MNFQGSDRNNEMASCGLETVNEPLEEAASQLSLDSNKKASYSWNFSRVRCIWHDVFALHPTVSGKLMMCQPLPQVN